MKKQSLSAALLISLCGAFAFGSRIYAPEVIRELPTAEGSALKLEDGTLKAFYLIQHKRAESITSRDNGRTWSGPDVEFKLPGQGHLSCAALLDKDGRLHAFFQQWRGKGKIAVSRFLDIWHCVKEPGAKQWSKAKRIIEGYVGSLRDVIEVKSGRIVVPYEYWVKGWECKPPHGCIAVSSIYSDDGGKSWKFSDARLTAPCYAGYPGSNYGANEPSAVQLGDGRVWMLMRTQTGYLYESFSDDGGDWSDTKRTGFYSSNSPTALERLSDGRIFLIWNNCASPPLSNGQVVYAIRDALHAAISSDDGKTWEGYREIYLDPRRNEPPPKRGDRGTAYPNAAEAENGNVVVVTGQGEGREVIVVLDPQWLCEKHREDDFSKGLEGWSVFKSFGPTYGGHWRERTQGAELVSHPDKEGRKVLHIRRPDERAGDGAQWNFPAGRKGRLELGVMLRKGFGKAKISLTDRFYYPEDARGEEEAMFVLGVSEGGMLSSGGSLEAGKWYTLVLKWNLDEGSCKVTAEGNCLGSIDKQHESLSGLSYLRLRCSSEDVDPAGFFVERVSVNVE